MRRCLALVGFCLVVHVDLLAAAWSSDSTAGTWGPEAGQVTWSLQSHGLTWETPHAQITLDPLFSIRGLSGPPQSTISSTVRGLDNLRGARFHATLDGAWTVSGSLEEFQGVPTAMDAYWMAENESNPSTIAVPGWGRAKTLNALNGVDVARARSSMDYVKGIGNNDSLAMRIAYAPIQWGRLPRALTLDGGAASYPSASLEWSKGQSLRLAGTMARWVGTERSTLGGSTESLFRQIQAGWVQAEWQPSASTSFGTLIGSSVPVPWTDEAANDSSGVGQFQPLASVVASWNPSAWNVAAEWSLTQGWGIAAGAPLSSSIYGFLSVSQTKAPNRWHTNAGTPVSATFNPSWVANPDETQWWLEGGAAWQQDRWNASIHVRQSGANYWVEAMTGYLVQKTWPLYVSAGLECWQVPNHPWMTPHGTRFRVGVSHSLSLGAGGKSLVHCMQQSSRP